MNPIIIIPPGEISVDDIRELRANGLCVVEAKNPASVKFVDPIPAQSSRTQIEDAAIKLSRKIFDASKWNADYHGSMDSLRKELMKAYLGFLIEGSPLDSRLTQAEQERKVYDTARLDEVQRMAREEARAERAKKKTFAEMPKRGGGGKFLPKQPAGNDSHPLKP